jgi:serine/threonine-protein kinase RsbW
VVNPRPSVAFGVQKSRDPHCTGFPSRPSGLGGSGSWGGQVFRIVTLDVTLETIELKFPSRIEAVGEAAAAVSQYMNRLGISEDVAFGIDMAVREAVTNAVLHGNKLDNAKFIEVTLRQTPEGFEIGVHDQGLGFNPDDVPDPTKDENLLKTSGRGIFFMRNFMDQVEWSPGSKGGTDVRMLKKL